MSAFIVKCQTIDRILSFLFFSSKSLYLAEDYTNEEKLTKIGRELLKMNIKAVNYRYSEKKEFSYAEKYSVTISPVSVFQALKSLKCLLYQCAEGNIPNTKLYREFREMEKRISDFIIYKLPDFEKAEWG